MKHRYPFDPSLKHHGIIALGLALWIFVFLYFTEPLDVNEFGPREKLIYLPFYGLAGAMAYLLMMPFQSWWYEKKKKHWSILSELLFFGIFILLGFIISRLVYAYIIVPNEPNLYTIGYYIKSIYLPAVSTILPIIIAGRWAFGKYKDKKLEDQKIEILGEGNFEGLRLQLNELIAIKADDNYIEVSYLSDTKLKKQLIRNKLTVIADAFPELIRSHRSHLINPYHFQQYKSEGGKQFLVLQKEIIAPISKTYAPAVKEAIQLATK